MYRDIIIVFTDGEKARFDRVEHMTYVENIVRIHVRDHQYFMFPICNIKKISFTWKEEQ